MNNLGDRKLGKREDREPFNDRVAILFDELELAIKWQRPSILLAVYGSEPIRIKAELALEKKLTAIGQRVYPIAINEELFDVPLSFSQYPPERNNSIFFITGIRRGGGRDGHNTYRALNLRREYFTSNQIRAIFWLTESEAVNLPHLSPDFWSFRHRVVEFVESPLRKHSPSSTEVLTWPQWKANCSPEEIDNEICLREHFLANLPSGKESQSARADLFYTLAALSWTKGEYEKSLAFLSQGMESAQFLQDASIQARFWVGLGFVSYTLRQTADAVSAYKKAIKLNPNDASAWSNLSNVYRNLNRISDAIDACKKAIKLAPEDADHWNNLGNAYRDRGRTEDAICAYEKATQLNPRDTSPWGNLGHIQHMLNCIPAAIVAYKKAIDLDTKDAFIFISLAACYRKTAHQEDADEQLAIASEFLIHDNEYARACFESVYGHTDRALELLHSALQKKQTQTILVRLDPNFDFIRDDPRFKALLGVG